MIHVHVFKKWDPLIKFVLYFFCSFETLSQDEWWFKSLQKRTIWENPRILQSQLIRIRPGFPLNFGHPYKNEDCLLRIKRTLPFVNPPMTRTSFVCRISSPVRKRNATIFVYTCIKVTKVDVIATFTLIALLIW